ncbi:PD40 domain-containing protein [Ancylomarina sp. 16SWW S1-10-2]|uniref:PD40 domain-containing protein n=1 Tax=Ancylomarina sp. 16SWW S1-10-2 TaxID=2499681 RepID=UPI0012ADCF36|nr:PD40 domain-containing protein [Ancylomarina sp. 16SWW S1-10-2]MRT91912.1 hypothetical protein [Ancylomarina sp. 16SWW S1-10-2]
MNSKNIIILLIFILFSFLETSGQNVLSVKKSDFVNNSTESVVAYSKIKEALALYQTVPNYADKCIALFMEAYKYNNSNPELNYNIGICHLQSNSKGKALDYLKKAGQLNPDVSNDLYYFMGLTLQYRYEFLNAIKMFNKNIELAIKERVDQNKTLIELCEKHINECKSGLKLQNSQTNKEVKLLDHIINSTYNDLNPILKDKTFYFSSQRVTTTKGKLLEKVYSASVDKESFKNFKKEDVSFNKDLNVAMVSYNGDNELAFYSGIDGGGDIFLAKLKQGKWILNESIYLINTPSSREASACIAGNELYFVSDRSGSYGECDIYYSTKNKGGEWSNPKNIGLDINTHYDEADVFVTPDGKELYFTSNGHNTMGGYDIFRCDRLENGKWDTPVNMGTPINSPYNDIQFFKSADGKEFFSSDRNGGFGGYDIYKIETVIEPELTAIEKQKAENLSATQENPTINKELEQKSIIEVIPELIYRVQILACKNEANNKELNKTYQGQEPIAHQFSEGFNKYAIGTFKTYREAAAFRDSCHIKGAFIVLFKNGKPLKIKRAAIALES